MRPSGLSVTSRWNSRDDVPRGDDYDARWAKLEADGVGVHGEADFVYSFEPQTVLDAGCGTGRVAIELARRGVSVVGVDNDPAMLARAVAKAPDLPWLLGDLARLDLSPTAKGWSGRGADGLDRFECIVAAGNVMIFLEPGTEARVVAQLAAHLEPGGRLIAGFQLGAGRLQLDSYDAMAERAGLVLDERWSTWDRAPFADGTYAVSVHRRDGSAD